jgi:hypothetical protein
MRITRRTLLKATAATATFAGLSAWGRRTVRAGTPAAKHVLFLNASGGLRTSAAFNASTKKELNPWGVLGNAGGLRIGKLLTLDTQGLSFEAPSWPGSPAVPGVLEAAPSWSMIAAVDHAPGLPRAGDHTDDSPRMGTGYYGVPAPGILTAINRYVGQSAPAPVAMIGATPLGQALGDWVAHAPVELEYYGLPSVPPTGGDPVVGRPLEDALDARLRKARGGLARAGLDAYLGTKQALRKYGPVLADPRLHIANGPLDAELDGITNQMLLEAVGVDQGSGQGEGFRVAMALRLVQMGSPAVCVDMGTFDHHSEEDTKAPSIYGKFARYLAGIHFALSRIPDGGGTLLDSTLVVTTSEFGRSPGDPATGFNDGAGSDHGSGDAWRYQAHVVFGAGIKPKILAETDDDNVPKEGKSRSTHSLLATIALAVGVSQDDVDNLWPPGSELYPEALPINELWD